MQKYFTRWLVVTIGLLCSLAVSAHDFEVDGIYYNITSETDLTVEVTYQGERYDDYENEYQDTVKIPEQVSYLSKTYYVTSIGSDAFYGCSSLTSITLPESVTSIGSDAFYGCSSLASITIPEGVTSIGGSAFSHCSSLTSIVIPEGVTSIGGYAFRSCSSLTPITIPEGVTSIGSGAFEGCESLTSINIPESVTSIGDYVFNGCSSLTAIAIPESVTSIGDYVFNGCSSLTAIAIPEGVTSIGYSAFHGCSSLTSIVIPEGVTSIGGNAFNNCENLRTITIPEGVTVISSGTFYQSGISSIVLPESLIYIYDDAFWNCYSLKTITIPKNVKYIGYQAFYACYELKSIINYSDLDLGPSHNSCIACYADEVSHRNVQVGDFYFSKIDENCSLSFYAGENANLVLPNSCNGEFYVIGEKAFYNYKNLITVTIPDSVTSIEESAFANCENLVSVTFGKNVKSVGDAAFSGCSSLTSVIIPDSVTLIEGSAFSGCSSLTSIIIPEGVASIEYGVFRNCSSLISISIPPSVTSIGNGAFDNCTSLKEIIFEDGSSTLYLGYNHYDSYNRGEGLFYDSPLEKVYLGRNLSYNVPEGNYYGTTVYYDDYGYSPFCYKHRLKTLIIGQQVTAIHTHAFRYCSRLCTVIIPNNVKSIGEYAFEGSPLHTLVIESESLTIESNAFSVKPKKTFWMTNTPPTNYEIAEGVVNYVGNDKYTQLTDGNVRIYPYLSSMFEVGGVKYIPVSPSERTCDVADCVESDTVTVAHVNDTVFYNGIGLKAINVNPYAFTSPYIETVKVDADTICTNSFYQCNALKELAFGTGLSNICDSAFTQCNKLSDIVIEDREETLTLGSKGTLPLFSGCSLDSVYIGGPLSYSTSSDKGYSPFYCNTSLRTVMMGDRAEDIYAYEFSGCSGLRSVSFGNVQRIGKEAFADSDSIEHIVSRVIYPPVCGQQALNDINKWVCKLQVPAGYKERYAKADQWKEFFFIEDVLSVPYYKLIYVVYDEIQHVDSLPCGEIITPSIYPTREGYTFNGWSEVPEAMPAHDITITGTFAINSYKLTYTVDGEEHQTDSVTYATPLIPIAEPAKEGYTFSGWSEVPDSMPAHDVTVTGTFTVNAYKVTYMVDGAVYRTDSVDYGTVIALPADPVKEGYTFSGWSGVPETMPAHDITITGAFLVINRYRLTYTVDGEVHQSDSVAYGSVITPLPEPVKEGYTFGGWSEIPETMPAEDVTVTGTFTLNASQTDQQGVIYELNAKGDAFEVAGYTENLSEDVVIPSQLYELPVKALREKALIGAEGLKSITLPTVMSEVGRRAFYSCRHLLVVEWNATAPVDAACFEMPSLHGNMLVFVSDAATEVTYKGNVVTNGKAENIVLTQNMPLRNPHAFTARNITYSHDFTRKTKIGEAGGWEALVLPFDVQTIVSEKKGALLPFGQADFSTSLPYWAAEMQADAVFSLVQKITANTPFIMQLPNSDEYEDIYNVEGTVTFSASDVMVHATTESQQPAANGYALLATYEGMDAADGVYALNDEDYTATDGSSYLPGGVFVANSRDIRPFEAYVYSESGSRAPYLRIGGKEGTGIGCIVTAEGDDAWYTLQGIRLGDKPQERGVYIRNGRKVIVK